MLWWIKFTDFLVFINSGSTTSWLPCATHHTIYFILRSLRCRYGKLHIPVPVAVFKANLSIDWSHWRLKRISDGMLKVGIPDISGNIDELLLFFSSVGFSDILRSRFRNGKIGSLSKGEFAIYGAEDTSSGAVEKFHRWMVLSSWLFRWIRCQVESQQKNDCRP